MQSLKTRGASDSNERRCQFTREHSAISVLVVAPLAGMVLTFAAIVVNSSHGRLNTLSMGCCRQIRCKATRMREIHRAVVWRYLRRGRLWLASFSPGESARRLISLAASYLLIRSASKPCCACAQTSMRACSRFRSSIMMRGAAPTQAFASPTIRKASRRFTIEVSQPFSGRS
jgi:hypothetical protein